MTLLFRTFCLHCYCFVITLWLWINYKYSFYPIRQKCKQYILKWDAVGSILKQTKRKHQLTIKICIKYVDNKSPVMRPNLQPKIYKSPVVAQQLYHMYATTRYNFVCLKATHKIFPLEELVGGRSPPSSSQRLTGMGGSLL